MFTVLLGNLSTTDTIQNIILLLGKKYLFGKQCKEDITINGFKNFVKLYCLTEHGMAYGANNVNFVERWIRLAEGERWME